MSSFQFRVYITCSLIEEIMPSISLWLTDFMFCIYSSVSGIMLFRRQENKKPVVSCWLSVIRLYLAQRLSFAVFNCSGVAEAAFLMQSLIIWQALFMFLLSVWQHTDKTPVLGSILEKML